MLVTRARPRVLGPRHAGPLLYGDWGTSRLYVLGLAFFFAAHASIVYLLAVGALMAAVAWAYTIVCRNYPDGGGVYTAARELNPTLSVVGATLLLCGYIMTAAISVVEALHYFGVPDGPGGSVILGTSVVVLGLIGAVNWLGAKSAGRFALLIAIAAIGVSAVLAVLSAPYLPKGVSLAIDAFGKPFETPAASWVLFCKLCLALAGVEAVANMTGIMTEPVERTAKRTLLPVLGEVAVLNIFFGLAFIAMSGALAPKVNEDVARLAAEAGTPAAEVAPLWTDPTVPLAEQIDRGDEIPKPVREVRDIAMKELAIEAGSNAFGAKVGFIFGKASAIVFGLLLLSATNTAVMAMVSVLFAMAQDRELPRALTKLNYPGVPWIGLIASCVIPALVLLVTVDVETLAKLYILGVCGAITVNVLSCAKNRRLQIRGIERAGLWALGVFLAAVSVTIAITQPESTAFVGTVVGVVLAMRQVLKLRAARQPEPFEEPESGWLSLVNKPPGELAAGKPRVMLAARGRFQAEYAVDLARRREAALFVIYVRTLRVMDLVPGRVPKVEDDPEAQASLGSVVLIAEQYGVPVVPIYVTSDDIVEEILDYTVTFNCDTLIMGKTKRRAFSRAIEGDVVSRVIALLPDTVTPIIRDATPHPMPPPPNGPNGTDAKTGEKSASEAARDA